LFNWREALLVVEPDTLIGWHCKGFRLFWKWKSKGGRRRLPRHIRQLIAEMAIENPIWDEERVANELSLKLGIQFLSAPCAPTALRTRSDPALAASVRSTGGPSSITTPKPWLLATFW
jgi:hypothetical protein